MPTTLLELQPTLIWKHFHGLTQVPRPSKKEEKILAYLTKLITDLGYTYQQDDTGNLVVRKPATPGYEHAPTVLIQGHVDMVCEKNKGTEFDFDNDSIRTLIDGDWVTADGTTLGADNGIGVAAGLAVLEAKDLVHPPMEFLFTVDEETGLTGAKGLKPGFLTASIMLNLDSEEDGALYVGCSGGMDTAGVMTVRDEAAPEGWMSCDVMVSGLKGGHSGLDIHTGRGSAIKFLARTLSELSDKANARISVITGGSKRNAIPREAEACLYIAPDMFDTAAELVAMLQSQFLNEIGTVEPGVSVTITSCTGNGKVMASEQQTTLLHVLHAMPHGVLKMSADIEGLVETSTNLATIVRNGDRLVIGSSQRSSVETEKYDAVRQVSAVFSLAGLSIEYGDGYPGWKPNMQSEALKYVRNAYHSLYNADPEIKAIHAGLECGLIGEVFPSMDMISFGPTIMGAHSPDERVSIPMVSKFWDLLAKVLEDIARNSKAA